MATGFANIRKPGYQTQVQVEQTPEVRHYGTRPKYTPRDYTGRVSRKDAVKTVDPNSAQVYQDSGTGVKTKVANLVGRVIRGNWQVNESHKNPNKSQDMIEEGRRSSIAQTFSGRTAMRMIRPIHNPTRKMYEEGYSQPIQEYGFVRTRQQNSPAAQRAISRGTTQAQPNVKNPQPTQPIPTYMPWNIPG